MAVEHVEQLVRGCGYMRAPVPRWSSLAFSFRPSCMLYPPLHRKEIDDELMNHRLSFSITFFISFTMAHQPR
jgi:hypothetical protein